MRFWRSIGLAAFVVASLTQPARAQDSTAAARPDSAAAKAAPVVARPAATRGSSVPARRAWMMGFGYGYGGTRFVGSSQDVIAELRSDTGTEYPPLVSGRPDWSGTDIESAPAVQFRFGYAINPHWMVGFERSGWTKDFTAYKWNFALSMMTATYFVGEGGFFVRGGGGISTLSEKVVASENVTATLAANANFAAPFFVQYEDHGFALEMAAGWERRLYQRISIAPEVSIRSMLYGDGIRAQIGAGALGFNWWF